MADRPTSLTCPNCRQLVTVDPGYPPWCDRCGWNVAADLVRAPANAFERLYLQAGKRLSSGLLAELRQAPQRRAGLSAARLLAAALAALVHGVTIALVVLGVAFLVGGWPHPAIMFFGPVFLLVAWLTRPRLGRVPDDIVARAEVPALYRLVDSVADAVGAPRVHAIVIDHEFNAAIAQVGWRRRPVLWLGLPYVLNLDRQGLVGLVGHEVAHTINGDPVRSWVVGSALWTLAHWEYFAQPTERWSFGLPSLLMVPVNLLAMGVAAVIRGYLLVLVHLVWRDSQRSEYLADLLGAQASGRAGALNVLDQLLHWETFRIVVREAALRNPENDLFEVLEHRVRDVPPREVERRRRVRTLAAARLDATHPPHSHRAEFLRVHAPDAALVVCPQGEYEVIQRELRTFRPRLQRKLVSEYRDELYHG